MAKATHFPLSYPSDVRPLFVQDNYLRRLVGELLLTPQSRALVLGLGATNVVPYLARDVGCQVVAADASLEAVKGAEEKAKSTGITDRVSFKHLDDYQKL